MGPYSSLETGNHFFYIKRIKNNNSIRSCQWFSTEIKENRAPGSAIFLVNCFKLLKCKFKNCIDTTIWVSRVAREWTPPPPSGEEDTSGGGLSPPMAKVSLKRTLSWVQKVVNPHFSLAKSLLPPPLPPILPPWLRY